MDIFKVRCSNCGQVINTQTDYYRRQRQNHQEYFWHIPTCPTQGERDATNHLFRIADVARSVH